MNYDHWKSTNPYEEPYQVCCGEPVPMDKDCPKCCEEQLNFNKEMSCNKTNGTQLMHESVWLTR